MTHDIEIIYDNLHDNTYTINRKYISKIIQCINLYKNKINNNKPHIYCGINIICILTDTPIYNINFNLKNNVNGVNGEPYGKLMGYDVYISYHLKENQIYIGYNENEILSYKRKAKINKIINRNDI